MSSLTKRWDDWAASSAARRQRYQHIADADFDLPRVPMSVGDRVWLVLIVGLSAGFVWRVVDMLAGNP